MIPNPIDDARPRRLPTDLDEVWLASLVDTPPRLTIELVPKTSWGDNIRSAVKQSVWDKIRRAVYAAAGHRCEVCGSVGMRKGKASVDCHEVWQYDDEAHIQTLVRMVALCLACHGVKHIGRTRLMGYADEATLHLATVNGWTEAQADMYIAASFRVWRERSQNEWSVNLDALTTYGVAVPSIQGREQP